LQHSLDVRPRVGNPAGWIGGKVDVGENTPKLTEYQNATAQLNRLLELVGDYGCGIALTSGKFNKGRTERAGGYLIKVPNASSANSNVGSTNKGRASATRCSRNKRQDSWTRLAHAREQTYQRDRSPPAEEAVGRAGGRRRIDPERNARKKS
jgi:hypothetical protein